MIRYSVIPLLALLVACQSTSYKPISKTEKRHFGYEERELAEGKYTLFVRVSHRSTGAADAKAMWHRRAIELCDGNKYDYNIYSANKYALGYPGNASNVPTQFEMKGLLTCQNSVLEPEESDVATPAAN